MKQIVRLAAGLTLVACFGFATFSGSASAGPAAAQQLFRNCGEAEAAGFDNIRQGEPGYTADLDADGDGIACEAGESAPAPAPAPAPEPQAQAVPGAVPPAEVQGATQERLATTGLTALTPVLIVTAFGLLLAGRQLISAGYERLEWLPGRRPEVRFTVEQAKRRRR